MGGHDPLSSRGLILSSIFVAVSIAGIGILGQQQGSAEIAATQPNAMTAATQSSTAQSCLVQAQQQNANTSNAVDYQCLPGCNYTVEIGLDAALKVVPSGTPSKTNSPPGQVYYEPLIGGAKGPVQCGANGTVAGTAQANFNDLNSRAFSYQAVPPATASGLDANYAPGAVTKEVLPGSVNSTGYTSTNLPTQQGTYPLQGVPGGLVSYTPGANGAAGAYNLWSTNDYNAGIIGAPTAGGGGTALGGASPVSNAPSAWVNTSAYNLETPPGEIAPSAPDMNPANTEGGNFAGSGGSNPSAPAVPSASNPVTGSAVAQGQSGPQEFSTTYRPGCTIKWDGYLCSPVTPPVAFEGQNTTALQSTVGAGSSLLTSATTLTGAAQEPWLNTEWWNTPLSAGEVGPAYSLPAGEVTPALGAPVSVVFESPPNFDPFTPGANGALGFANNNGTTQSGVQYYRPEGFMPYESVTPPDANYTDFFDVPWHADLSNVGAEPAPIASPAPAPETPVAPAAGTTPAPSASAPTAQSAPPSEVPFLSSFLSAPLRFIPGVGTFFSTLLYSKPADTGECPGGIGTCTLDPVNASK